MPSGPSRPRAFPFAWLALVFAGAWAACEARSQPAGGPPGAGGGPGGPPPALVAVAPVREGSLVRDWRYLGEVRPMLRADLAAGAAGRVLAVHKREGDRVAEGEVVLELDASLVRPQLAAAEASLAELNEELRQARRESTRAKGLGHHVLTVQEVERLRSRVATLAARADVLRAQIDEARALLARHTLTAPFAGVVTTRAVHPGDWVGVDETVLGLMSTEDAEVHVEVAAEVLGQLTLGSVATLHGPDTLPADTVTADVRGVVPALDLETRTARVRLDPRQPTPWLVPGAAVDVSFALTEARGGVLVHRDALLIGPAETRVVRLVDGQAQPVVVRVVATSATEALVEAEGLAAGQEVVTRGNERLRPGQPVQLAPDAGGQPPPAAAPPRLPFGPPLPSSPTPTAPRAAP